MIRRAKTKGKYYYVGVNPRICIFNNVDKPSTILLKYQLIVL